MLARLHVIVDTETPNEINDIKQQLLKINPQFSISPEREYAGIKDHSEFFITFTIQQDDIQSLLNQLNNDWEGEQDDCICYGFNTKMFNPNIYYLGFTVY